MHNLRLFIKLLLEEEQKTNDEELLVEPDETEGRPEREISSGGVAGATVPLGASSAHHPGTPRARFPSSKVGKKNSKNA